MFFYHFFAVRCVLNRLAYVHTFLCVPSRFQVMAMRHDGNILAACALSYLMVSVIYCTHMMFPQGIHATKCKGAMKQALLKSWLPRQVPAYWLPSVLFERLIYPHKSTKL